MPTDRPTARLPKSPCKLTMLPGLPSNIAAAALAGSHAQHSWMPSRVRYCTAAAGTSQPQSSQLAAVGSAHVCRTHVSGFVLSRAHVNAAPGVTLQTPKLTAKFAGGNEAVPVASKPACWAASPALHFALLSDGFGTAPAVLLRLPLYSPAPKLSTRCSPQRTAVASKAAHTPATMP